jgi:transglutaminase-like putative cysteine protease
MKLLVNALKAGWWLAVIATPLLGAWIASSMAAYHNGPAWAALLAGVLLFPALPLAWEARAAWRRRGRRTARHLTFADRLILRTLVINLLFLGPLLYRSPGAAFTATSARGDWMLDGRSGPEVERLRGALFAAAAGLEWLHDAVHENPYADMAERRRPPPPPSSDELPPDIPREVPAPDDLPAPDEAPSPDEIPPPDEAPPPEETPAQEVAPPRQQRPAAPWPRAEAPHPNLAALSGADLRSVEAAARALVAGEGDPFERVKALHDFAADHVDYDFESLDAGRYPPQDAATVFKTGRGVCAGYANLLVALGEAAGEEIVFISGDSRDLDGDIAGGGHAWNAARIEGAWYLIDATWDAGRRGDSGSFEEDYSTDWLFTPASIFARTHLPDDEAWQLLQTPISRGEFLRAPMMRPDFYAAGLMLVDPDRSQITVGDSASLTVNNPRGVDLMVKYKPRDGGEGRPCEVAGRGAQTVTCEFPEEGDWRLHFYLPDARTPGLYWSAGQLEINSTGA